MMPSSSVYTVRMRMLMKDFFFISCGFFNCLIFIGLKKNKNKLSYFYWFKEKNKKKTKNNNNNNRMMSEHRPATLR